MKKKISKLDEERYNKLREGKKFGVTQAIQIFYSVMLAGIIYLLLFEYQKELVSTIFYVTLIVSVLGFITYKIFE